MSRVYFSSPSGEAEILGSERAHAGCMVNDLTTSQFRTDNYQNRAKNRYSRVLPSGNYLSAVREEFWMKNFATAWCVGMDRFELPHGLTPFQIGLNTAVYCFGDAIEFMARMHATCEINGWVEGEHRAWFADIIEEGRRRNVMRPGAGWEGLIGFLRSNDEEPVVMTYSVADGFPEAYLVHQAGLWSPEPYPQDEWDGYTADELLELREIDKLNWDTWYDIPDDKQWELGMEALRKNWTGQVDIHPDMWGKRGFGHEVCWTIFDLENWLDEQERSDV
jgi:hypothetical protein